MEIRRFASIIFLTRTFSKNIATVRVSAGTTETSTVSRFKLLQIPKFRQFTGLSIRRFVSTFKESA